MNLKDEAITRNMWGLKTIYTSYRGSIRHDAAVLYFVNFLNDFFYIFKLCSVIVKIVEGNKLQ